MVDLSFKKNQYTLDQMCHHADSLQLEVETRCNCWIMSLYLEASSDVGDLDQIHLSFIGGILAVADVIESKLRYPDMVQIRIMTYLFSLTRFC
jgi:hypothetical protein